MKTKILLGFLLLFALANIKAQTFSVNSLNYNITDTANKTVEVGDNTTYTANTVNIPATVTYNNITYTVTAIANQAFKGNTALQELNLSLATNLKTIGTSAFEASEQEMTGEVDEATQNYYIETKIPYSKIEKITYHQSNLTVVNLGSYVISIGDRAFYGCSKITNISIPNSVNSIGVSAFETVEYDIKVSLEALSTTFVNTKYSTSLIELNLGNSLQTIGDRAFYGCFKITSLTIPDSVTSIGISAFEAAPFFNQFFFSESRKYETNLTELTLGSSLVSIGNRAFYGCSKITNLSIPNSVTIIGTSAFEAANNEQNSTVKSETNLTSLDLGNSLQTIGDRAFYGCSKLTSLTIPNSVTTIGISAFEAAKSELSFFISSINFQTNLTEVFLGSSLVSIGDRAFYGCSKLTSVTIPDSVTSIGTSAFEASIKKSSSVLGLGSSVSYETSLIEIFLGSSLVSIGDRAFYGCSKLTSLTIPNSVTSIGISAFEANQFEKSGNFFSSSDSNYYTTSLTSVNLGSSLVSLGDRAFYGCFKITSVSLENSVPIVINENVFQTLNNVFYGNNIYLKIPDNSLSSYTEKPVWKNFKSIGESNLIGNSFTNNGLKYNITSIEPSTVAVGDNTNYIGENLVIPSTLSHGTDGEGNSIEYSVSSISKKAFNGNTTITGGLTLGENITNIEGAAFYGCTGLTGNLSIPDSVTSIGGAAFGACTGFSGNLTIGSSVATIGTYAFYGCSNFTEVEVTTQTPAVININVFQSGDVSSPTFYASDIPLKVAYGSLEAYQETAIWQDFESIVEKDGIGIEFIDNDIKYIITGVSPKTVALADNTLYGNQTLSIPATVTDGLFVYAVTAISNSAFSGNTSLTSIEIGSGIQNIGDDAFYNCENLTSIRLKNSVPAVINANVFESGDINSPVFYASNVALEVPYGFLNNYNQADVWKDFKSITTNNPVGAEFTYSGVNYTITGSNPGSVAVADNTNYTAENLVIPNSVFYGTDELGNNIEYIVTSIGEKAFYENTNLTGSLTLGENITSIENFAFSSCTGLTGNLAIPDSVTSIGEAAFGGCVGFTGNLTLGSAVANIGDSAFYGIYNLNNVVVKNATPIAIHTNVFNTGNLDSPTFYGSNITLQVPKETLGAYEAALVWKDFKSIKEEGSVGTVLFYNGLKYSITGLTPKTVAVAVNTDYLGTSLNIPDTFNYGTDELGNSIEYTVTSIEDYAFVECTNLTTLTIGESVTNIGLGAFYKSGISGDLILPNTVTTIGQAAFSECKGLTGINIPDGVTTIEAYTFYNCSQLTSFTISDAITSIEQYAFVGTTNLSTLTIGNSVTNIGLGAFFRSGISGDLVLPNTVTTIGGAAFSACSGLTSINIPDGVTTLGAYTFFNCNQLTEITIPSTVNTIESNAFAFCTGLTTVSVKNRTPAIITSDVFNSVSIENIDLKVSVDTKNLYDAANVWKDFKSIEEDQSLTKQFSVNGIVYYVVSDVNKTVIVGNNTLYTGTYVSIPATVTDPNTGSDNNDDLGLDDDYDEGDYGDEFGGRFGDDTGSEDNGGSSDFNEGDFGLKISNINTNSNVTYTVIGISNHAFKNNTHLITLDLSTAINLKTMGTSAFEGCNNIVGKLTIPEFVNSIGDAAFKNCTGFTSVTAYNPTPVNIQANVFEGLTLSSIPLNVTNGNAISAYSVAEVWKDFSPITAPTFSFDGIVYNVTDLTNKIVEIGNNINYTGTEINIPETVSNGVTDFKVTNIAKDAFKQNSNITSLDLSAATSLDSIGQESFTGCTNLATVTLPNSLTNIDDFAFGGCSGLESIVIPDSVTSIGNAIFTSCTSLVSAIVGNSLTDLKSSVFNNCTSLKNVTIGSLVDTIGTYTFNDCTSLETIDVKNETPISGLNPNIFNGVATSNVYLNVPSITAKEAYEVTSVWEDFNVNLVFTIQNVSYTFTNDDTNTIMIVEVASSNKNVVVPNEITDLTTNKSYKVTAIGKNAFKDNLNIESIDLSTANNLTSIDESAFKGATNLTNVVLSSSIISIGKNAFEGASSLKEIVLTNLSNNNISISSKVLGSKETISSATSSITSIGDYAFSSTGLTSITIPSTVTSIGQGAFKNCNDLETVTVENEIPLDISGKNVFEGLTLSNITLSVPNDTASDNYSIADTWKLFKTESTLNTNNQELHNVFSVEIINNRLQISSNNDIVIVKNIQIISSLGSIVTGNYNSNYIDINNLTKGVYILSLYTNQGKLIKKFVKQ